MTRDLPGPHDTAEMRRFLDTFMYREEAFLVDEIVRLDRKRHEIEARLVTDRTLPFARLQRTGPQHPPHVSGAELLMVTADLGSLHAWFFHGCRWDEGWVGFGNRIHRADFSAIARIGPPIDLISRETRTRVSPSRIVIRFEFEFRQEGSAVYYGDQTAMFLRDAGLGGDD